MALSPQESVIIKLVARYDQEIAALEGVLVAPLDTAGSERVVDRLADLNANSARLMDALHDMQRKSRGAE